MAEMTSSKRLAAASTTTESALGVAANAARTANLPFGLPDPAGEQALQTRIGFHFADPMLLRLALTHRSVLPDWADL
ncbi:MAG: hypothetical protein M3N47_04460, partial [Chloroflexota bacterium]|nr:hypothetical protein [Chloroflexota bacterium]